MEPLLEKFLSHALLGVFVELRGLIAFQPHHQPPLIDLERLQQLPRLAGAQPFTQCRMGLVQGTGPTMPLVLASGPWLYLAARSVNSPHHPNGAYRAPAPDNILIGLTGLTRLGRAALFATGTGLLICVEILPRCASECVLATLVANANHSHLDHYF